MTNHKYIKIRNDLRRSIRSKKPGDARRAELVLRLKDHTTLQLAREVENAEANH